MSDLFANHPSQDTRTLDAYDSQAGKYAAKWEAQPEDTHFHALLTEHLIPGQVLDIGSGSGRETAWLTAQGWDARGYDASGALVEQARHLHPETRFDVAVLPALEGVEAAENVICETVLMHLEHDAALASVSRLAGLTKAGGRLFLSWRTAGHQDTRDENGRLYAAIDSTAVKAQLKEFTLLVESAVVSESSGAGVYRLILARD